jgi:yecA family protein
MRMSKYNIFPNYSSLTVALNQQAVALTAAELHGLISGLLCGGSRDASWPSLIHNLTHDGLAFPQSLSHPLQKLYEKTHKMLKNDGFMFQPLLSEGETVSVFERADALAGWVNYFLLGLGVMQPKLEQVKGEVGEAIDDLRIIAQLGYDEDEDQETLKQSLEEVVEYVRVAAILCHTKFTHQAPIAPQKIKPMLH